MPGVQEGFRENGVETEKNRDKSSNCDVCVTCDDVRCFTLSITGPGNLLNHRHMREVLVNTIMLLVVV